MTTAEKITVACDIVSLFNICVAAYLIHDSLRSAGRR